MNKESGFLKSGHPYTYIDDLLIVDYMPYEQYLFQKRMEENPEELKKIKEISKSFFETFKDLKNEK